MAVTRIPIPAWAKTQKADDQLGLSLSEIDTSLSQHLLVVPVF